MKSRIGKATDVVRYRPKSTIKVYSDKMPSVKDLKVGETVTLVIKAKVKSIYAGDSPYGDEDRKENKTLCAILQVTDVEEE